MGPTPLRTPDDRPIDDRVIAAFSDDPPWTVDPGALAWRNRLEVVRDVTRREVPELTRARRLPHTGRLLAVAGRLAAAIAPWWLGARRRGGTDSRADLSRRLRLAATGLGPTFIKLGQIISSGQGVFPEELVEEFELCRDRVPPEPFADIRRVVEEDLGARLEDVFSSFSREPIAAASIAQVHEAVLRDGVPVVVKVQRPAVEVLVHRDLKVLSWLAPLLVGRIPVTSLANPPAVVEVFAQTISEELDFRLEAENMLDVGRSLADLGQRGYVVPRPHPELVTRRVLVMERLSGFAFDDVAGIQEAGVDTTAVIRTGMIGFLEGCLLEGVFHGDLHFGNLLVLPDGRTAMLDFGIVGRLDEHERLAFLRLVMAGTMNDVRSQLEAVRDLGALPHDADLDAVIDELGLDQPAPDPTAMTGEEIAAELQRVTKALLGYGARLPKELILFIKNLVFLDNAIGTLAPDLDLFTELTEISRHFAVSHGERIAAEVGIDPRTYDLDLDAVRSSLGLDPDAESITHRELRERRELLRERMAEHRRSP